VRELLCGCSYREANTIREVDEEDESTCPQCGRGHDSFTWAATHGGLEDYQRDPLSWVVVGGESGSNARMMSPAWVKGLREQCVEANVPFYFKQWGEYASVSDGFGGEVMKKMGKRNAGRMLDGREWSEFPYLSTNQI